MKKSLLKRVNIFLSLEPEILQGYFNPQDHAPLYRRQLSNEFEQYILNSVRPARRNTKVCFKINYHSEAQAQYAEPLMYAIRRHFSEAKDIMSGSFENFRRRTFKLLFVSLSVVMVTHWMLPVLLHEKEENLLHTGLTNSLDVFSWVILWKPIDRLIFYWNPFLKDISIYERLEKAEVDIVQIEE
jgi:hypothetical protein